MRFVVFFSRLCDFELGDLLSFVCDIIIIINLLVSLSRRGKAAWRSRAVGKGTRPKTVKAPSLAPRAVVVVVVVFSLDRVEDDDDDEDHPYKNAAADD